MRWAVVLLLLPLAGCLDEGAPAPEAPPTAVADPFFDDALPAIDLSRLSAPVHDLLPVVEEIVVMSDGTAIHNAVFRPDTDVPVPVFINFSPYWGDTATAKGDNFGHYMVDNFVPRGYAVVLSSLRGTGPSEGCFEVGSDREVRDLYEVIDHFADASWSNGAVAAGGKSYDSTPQNGLIANHPHPALKGLFHVSGITDMYSYTFRHGVLERVDGGLFTTTYSSGYGGDQTCPEYLEGIVFPASTTVTGLKTDYWIERDWTRTIGDSDWDGSIFFYHGYQDWNVQPSHILPWLDNLPEPITAKTKVWLHQDTENNGHQYPQRSDWNVTMLRWMDSELKGIDTGFWDEPRVEVEDVSGTWHRLGDWPAAPIPVSTEATGTTGATPKPVHHVVVEDAGMADADGDTHITGALRIHVQVTAVQPDAVATAVVRLNGEWVGEAVLRLVYRDGLDAPSPVVPGQAMDVMLETYPLDVVVGPQDALTLEFGQDTAQTLLVPTQLEGVTYGAPVTVDLPATPPTPLLQQPRATPCFAC